MRVISSGRQQQVAPIDLAAEAGAASTVQGEAVSIDPAVEADPAIWTARLRTGRAVTFRANGSRAFKAAALIDLGAVEDLGVIDLVAGDSVAAVIVLAAAALAGLAGSAVAAVGSGAGDRINAWNFQILFLEKLKTTN